MHFHLFEKWKKFPMICTVTMPYLMSPNEINFIDSKAIILKLVRIVLTNVTLPKMK